MTTIVNNPVPTRESGGSAFLVGIIVLVVFAGVLLYFGIPALKNMGPIQANIPAPQVNIPEKIDVNVTQE